STIGASFAPVMSTIFKVADSTLGKLTPVFAGAEKTISGPFQQIGVILAQSLASPSVVTAVKGLASSFGEFLKGFAPQIPGIVNAIANGVEGMASAFTDHPGLIKGMGSVLAFLFKIPGFVAGALGSLTRVTAWLIGGFPHAVSIGLDAARNFFINIGHDIEAAWNTVWDDIKGITSTGAGAMSSIWTTITGPFRAGYNFVVGIFNGIKNYITTNFDKWWAANGASVIQLWNETWSRIKGIIDTILPPVINAVKVGLGIIIGVFTIAANAIVAAWNILWATLIGAAKIVWAEVQAVVKVGWAIISATFKTAIDIVVSIWRIFWAVISNVAKLSFTLIKNTLKLTWDIIVGIFTIFIDVITGHWSAALNAMKNLGIQVWNILKSNLSAIWNAIKAIGIAIFNALRAFFAGMWNNTKNTALASWNAVKNGLVNIWHAAVNAGKSIWNSFFGWLRSGWHAVVSSAGTIWNGIKTAIRTPVAWVVNNVWDPFANIINTATSFLHLGKPLPVKHMAGGGRLPGYGGGDKYPALLEAGETVVDKKKSRMYAGLFAAMGVPGYAAGGVAGGRPPVNLHTGVSNSGPTGGPGLGDVLNVGKTVVGFGAKLIQGAVLGVVKPAVNGILGLLSHMPGGDTGFGKMVAGLPKAVANKFFDFIGGKDKAFTATMIKNVGSGVARWAGLVNKALQMLGLPLSLASRVLYQMQTESGGNPNAINNTDINAQRGDPSRGLLQTIGSTFRAYHVAGTSNNIYDPLANIAAAINYARHVYGPTLMSGGMGMGSGHGYYIGTSNATRGWHMVGERGPEAMWFGGGEKVVPAGRVRGGDGASAPIILNVNFRGQALVSKAEIGRTVKAAIAYAERHGD
ncbi:MAG: transglycosylase SLT domain-containing protein, partial [Candidatus Saccharimonadales bacterium]